jgi:hypothetical protein
MAQFRYLMLALGGGAALALVAGLSQNADARGRTGTSAAAANPVVVELFQSQGCSSCPPANAYLNALADRPDLITLSFGVTYWDRLGWKDTFAAPAYTARQRDYAKARIGEVATPEFIVDGAIAVLGSSRAELNAAIAKAKAAKAGPAISFSPDSVRIAGTAPRTPADVWLVRYDPRSRQVPIQAGENSGRTLPHRHIVRQLTRLGSWSGPAARYEVPTASEAGLETAVLVQQGAGGPVIAAARQ